MLNQIVEALQERRDLSGWSLRHVTTRGAQVYTVPEQIESQRVVSVEQFKIDVFRQAAGPEGTQTMGSGNATLLPGGDIQAAIDSASLMAGLVANPVHSIPAPAPLPEVALSDSDILKHASSATHGIMERIRSTASRHPEVRLTAAECFSEIHTTHMLNSRGIDAEQESTDINLEFVLHSRRGDKDVETFREMNSRRVEDLNLEDEIERRVGHTLDLFDAAAAPSWQGPVVLRADVLALFMGGESIGGGVLQTLGSAASKYAKISSWEIGKSVFRKEVKGDPLTVWANRCIPFGTGSNRFDEEGLPAQRVALIRDNDLLAFAASQRYADYINIPATGAFGGVELPAGQVQAAALLAEPYVEIIEFSWFNPDTVTGDFASEIRLGYLVENGKREPFKGGQLIGNYLDALADVRWSAETGFFGNYLGPHTARFNELKIAGLDE